VKRLVRAVSLTLLIASGTIRTDVSATELFLTPQFEARAGYESNRYGMEEAAGSAFFSLVPGCELSAFLSETTELNCHVSHESKEFVRDSFGGEDATRGSVDLWIAGGAWEYGIALAGVGYKDASTPTNDVTRASISPAVVYTNIEGTRYTLGISLGGYRYAHLETADGETLKAVYFSLTPGIRWSLSRNLSLSADLFSEATSSNEQESENHGYGAKLGLDYGPDAPMSAGVTVQFGIRSDLTSESLEQKSVSMGLWYEYRIAPWMELRANVLGGRYRNEDTALDYDQWALGVGCLIRHDLEFGFASY